MCKLDQNTTIVDGPVAIVEYFIGHRVGGVADFKLIRQKLPLGLGKMPIESPLFLLSARMLPGYGPKFISVTSGICRVPFWRYLWTTAISTVVGAALVAYGGYGVLSFMNPN